jgi:hypothetical protein
LLYQLDDGIKDCLCEILNLDLDDGSWLQATLPIREGGLGVRRAADVALPAFLASLHGSAHLVSKILPPRLATTDDKELEQALTQWSGGLQSAPPFSAVQRQWDAPLIAERKKLLLASQWNDEPTKQRQARLLAVGSQGSGDWLNALPSENLGLKIDNQKFKIAVALRLGVKCCQPHFCSLCYAQVSSFGTHGLSCKRSAGRHSRHASVNSLISRALQSARIPCTLEPVGLSRNDGKRPDGLTLTPWSHGKSLIWDFTCSDTLAPSNLARSSSAAAAVAEDAEIRKSTKYSVLASQYIFGAISVETLGAWGPKSFSLLKKIGNEIAITSGEPKSLQYLMQRISVAIQRGNAASILATMPKGGELF